MDLNSNEQLGTLPLFQSEPKPKPETATRKHWTVTEFTQKIKGVLEPSFQSVWIQGEISNLKSAASGHLYFSLKDEGATLASAAFGWHRKKQAFQVKDGLEVLCRGKISVYAPRGSYQLIVDRIEPLGDGALQVAFEQLKKKLSDEGLFDQTRKKALPKYPKRVAIITSPGGAAVRDFLSVLKKRAPQIEVTLIPSLVQGEEAPRQLVRALKAAERLGLGEVIVLSRGGGSLEDLWAFNDESLARAVAECKVPVVSAVGHEVDFTISDFVSDLRAPTPTGAAEILSHHWIDFVRRVNDCASRLSTVLLRDLHQKRQLLAHLAARVKNPQDQLREKAQRCDELYLRLTRAWSSGMEQRTAWLERVMAKLDALSPLKVLDRGYSIVQDPGTEEVVRCSESLEKGDRIRVRFAEGQGEAIWDEST